METPLWIHYSQCPAPCDMVAAWLWQISFQTQPDSVTEHKPPYKSRYSYETAAGSYNRSLAPYPDPAMSVIFYNNTAPEMPSSPKFNHSITRTSRMLINMFLISIPALLFVTSSFWFGVILGQCTRNSGTWSVRVLWQKNTSSQRLTDIPASDLEAESVYVNPNADPVTDLSVRRHRVMAFVGIMTGYASSGRRKSLRNTWMPSDQQSLQKMEEATGLAFRFIIGKTNDKAKNQELHNELLKYDDFMVLDFLEEAIKPPYKIYSFFKAAYALFECEYYVKVQDDIYLRPDRLSLLLAKDRPHSPTYLGCMSRTEAEVTSQLEMYEKRLLGSENVLHAQRSIYALSADIVANLVALGQNSLRMFHSEEVTVGAWMLAMNVNYEDNKQLCESKCSSRSIVVTDFPNCSGLCDAKERLLELHGQAACSKSPTHSESQILRFFEWGNLLKTQARKGQDHAGNRRLP